MPKFFQFRTRQSDGDIEKYIEACLRKGVAESDVIRDLIRRGMASTQKGQLDRIEEMVRKIRDIVEGESHK